MSPSDAKPGMTGALESRAPRDLRNTRLGCHAEPRNLWTNRLAKASLPNARWLP